MAKKAVQREVHATKKEAKKPKKAAPAAAKAAPTKGKRKAPDESKTPEGDETDSDDEPIGKGVHHNGKAAARRAWLESYMDDNEPDADADDELVGCIALHAVDRGLTWIDYVIVLEKHRGHGLASHAFTHVPGDRIELLVSSENAAGRGLHRGDDAVPGLGGRGRDWDDRAHDRAPLLEPARWRRRGGPRVYTSGQTSTPSGASS